MARLLLQTACVMGGLAGLVLLGASRLTGPVDRCCISPLRVEFPGVSALETPYCARTGACHDVS